VTEECVFEMTFPWRLWNCIKLFKCVSQWH